MKRIVAINCSPRIKWNTWEMVNAAAEGAKAEGAEIEFVNLYRLDRIHGCMSCFACKRKPNEGKCVFPDDLKDVLEKIRNADGLIIGSPNYLGDVSAAFRAIYERLEFQSLTYNMETPRYPFKRIPVLFIMTSNASEEYYPMLAYDEMVKRYQEGLEMALGRTKVLLATNTLQVKDYSRYNWTMFDPQDKQERHDKVFPEDLKKAFSVGSQMVREAW